MCVCVYVLHSVYNNHARESFSTFYGTFTIDAILFFFPFFLFWICLCYNCELIAREKWVNHFKNVWKHITWLTCAHAMVSTGQKFRGRDAHSVKGPVESMTEWKRTTRRDTHRLPEAPKCVYDERGSRASYCCGWALYCVLLWLCLRLCFRNIVQYATECKCVRAVKSVAVQVWIALILLLLSLLLLSLRVCCAVYALSLFFTHSFVYTLHHRLFTFTRTIGGVRVYECACACVCWCMACFWLCLCCVWNGWTCSSIRSFSLSVSLTYTRTHCERNMLGHKIRWLWLVSVDLLTSAGNKIASNIPQNQVKTQRKNNKNSSFILTTPPIVYSPSIKLRIMRIQHQQKHTPPTRPLTLSNYGFNP